MVPPDKQAADSGTSAYSLNSATIGVWSDGFSAFLGSRSIQAATDFFASGAVARM